MSRGKQPVVIGVVISSAVNQPSIPPALQEATRRNRIELRVGLIEGDVIDRLVSPILRAESPSWILLHGEDDDRNVLVVPYVVEMADRSDLAFSESSISLLLETIRGDRNRRWAASDGQHNLIVAARQGRLSQLVRCFQAIHLPIPLGEIMGSAMPVRVAQHASAASAQVFQRLVELSRGIDLDREGLLSSLAGTPAHVAVAAREAFDDGLIKRAFDLAAMIGHAPGPGRRPNLAGLLGPVHDLLHPESRRFLDTSLIVEEAAVQAECEEFDYAAAACPLWKAVELELNLSIGWLIRILRRVATVESPWRAHSSRSPGEQVFVPTGTEPQQRVELNERDSTDHGQLKGLMLGAMRYLLIYGEQNGLRDEIMDQPLSGWTREQLGRFLFTQSKTSLPKSIGRLASLRNEHAHIRAMSRRGYEAVKKCVLGRRSDGPHCLLARTLALKQMIQDFVGRANADRIAPNAVDSAIAGGP